MDTTDLLDDFKRKVEAALTSYIGQSVNNLRKKQVKFHMLWNLGYFEVPASTRWWREDIIHQYEERPNPQINIGPDRIDIDYYVKGSSYDVGRCSTDCCTVELEVGKVSDLQGEDPREGSQQSVEISPQSKDSTSV